MCLSLGELRLHNGTIYRWNRPIYDVVRDQPHLRVENRVLPAGPTVVDILANAALYYGLLRVIADEERPVWSQMSFSAAEENFHAGARDGIDARLYWPGLGEVPAAELVLRRLLPLAHEGLERCGVESGDTDRLLGIIERRCVTLRNGASWQSEIFHRLYEDHVDGPPRSATADDARSTASTCTQTNRSTTGRSPESSSGSTTGGGEPGRHDHASSARRISATGRRSRDAPVWR